MQVLKETRAANYIAKNLHNLNFGVCFYALRNTPAPVNLRVLKVPLKSSICIHYAGDWTFQPPTVQPPTFQPPTIQPPTFQPPTFQPPTIQPPTFQPLIIQPPTFQLPIKADLPRLYCNG